MTEILNAVPLGSDNALSAREIWRTLDGFAEAKVSDQLNRLADSRAIKRRKEPTHGLAFRWRYFREGAAA